MLCDNQQSIEADRPIQLLLHDHDVVQFFVKCYDDTLSHVLFGTSTCTCCFLRSQTSGSAQHRTAYNSSIGRFTQRLTFLGVEGIVQIDTNESPPTHKILGVSTFDNDKHKNLLAKRSIHYITCRFPSSFFVLSFSFSSL